MHPRRRYIQILPDIEETRVLRDALMEYQRREDVTEQQRDMAWKLLAEITAKLRKELTS